MPNVLTILEVSPMIKQRRIRYGVVLTGAYVQAVRGTNVGEVLIPNNAIGKFDSQQYWGFQGPKFGEASQVPAGYTATLLPGADSLHWLLKLFSAPGTELAAGAYPAGILADIDAVVEFWGADYK